MTHWHEKVRHLINMSVCHQVFHNFESLLMLGPSQHLPEASTVTNPLDWILPEHPHIPFKGGIMISIFWQSVHFVSHIILKRRRREKNVCPQWQISLYLGVPNSKISLRFGVLDNQISLYFNVRDNLTSLHFKVPNNCISSLSSLQLAQYCAIL